MTTRDNEISENQVCEKEARNAYMH